jgi:hypothetical protein
MADFLLGAPESCIHGELRYGPFPVPYRMRCTKCGCALEQGELRHNAIRITVTENTKWPFPIYQYHLPCPGCQTSFVLQENTDYEQHMIHTYPLLGGAVRMVDYTDSGQPHNQLDDPACNHQHNSNKRPSESDHEPELPPLGNDTSSSEGTLSDGERDERPLSNAQDRDEAVALSRAATISFSDALGEVRVVKYLREHAKRMVSNRTGVDGGPTSLVEAPESHTSQYGITHRHARENAGVDNSDGPSGDPGSISCDQPVYAPPPPRMTRSVNLRRALGILSVAKSRWKSMGSKRFDKLAPAEYVFRFKLNEKS